MTAIVVILILSNIVFEFLSEEDKPDLKTEEYIFELDSIFLSSLDKFAIKPEWIDKKSINNQNMDSLKYVYYIQVPPDQNITEILSYIYSDFEGRKIEIESEELQNHQRSVLKIFSAGNLKHQSFFTRSKKLSESKTSISFVIFPDRNLSLSELETLCHSVDPFDVCLIPSHESLAQKGILSQAGKSAIIFLSDNISDRDFRLEQDLPRGLLIQNIERIINSFPERRLVYINTNSDIYNSTLFAFIKSEFERRGFTFITNRDFIKLTMEDKKEMKSIFDFQVAQIMEEGHKSFLISPENYLSLNDAVEDLKLKRVRIHQFLPNL